MGNRPQWYNIPLMNVTALMVGRLGDLLVTTPLLRALKRKWPQARLRLAVSPLGEDAARRIPAVDEVLALGEGLPALWKLKSGACDLLVDLNPSFSKSGSALVLLTPAKTKLGFQKDKLEWIYTKRVRAPGEKEHM